jgi:hypothetical protein
MADIAGTGDYRILITGSRDWADDTRLSFELGAAIGEACRTGHPMASVVIVHGDCPTGADAMADAVARHYGYRVERHPADWRPGGKLDKSAGYRRNAEMVAAGADLCLCFLAPCAKPRCREPRPHPSHGGSHCADLAERSGIKVRRFTP